jgi:hypothetical protein
MSPLKAVAGEVLRADARIGGNERVHSPGLLCPFNQSNGKQV